MSHSTAQTKQIVAQIQTILAQRGQDATADTTPADSDTISRHLYQVTLANQSLPTGTDLSSSSISSLPLIGPLLASLRRQAHQLTLYYVNRAAGHQIGVNHELHGAIAELQKLVLEQQQQIEELERQLAQRADQRE